MQEHIYKMFLFFNSLVYILLFKMGFTKVFFWLW